MNLFHNSMKTKSLFFLAVLILLITACSGFNPSINGMATPTITQVSSAETSSGRGSFFAITEVGLGNNGYVALTNFTDVPASLAGLYLCQGAACFELPDVVAEAGETARIAVGDGAGQEGVIELRPSDGEVALYVSKELDDPQAMLIYFQWGSDPHDLTRTAIEAGLWVEGGYGPSSQNATRLFMDENTGLWLFDE